MKKNYSIISIVLAPLSLIWLFVALWFAFTYSNLGVIGVKIGIFIIALMPLTTLVGLIFGIIGLKIYKDKKSISIIGITSNTILLLFYIIYMFLK